MNDLHLSIIFPSILLVKSELPCGGLTLLGNSQILLRKLSVGLILSSPPNHVIKFGHGSSSSFSTSLSFEKGKVFPDILVLEK